jgi:hypothetical protein
MKKSTKVLYKVSSTIVLGDPKPSSKQKMYDFCIFEERFFGKDDGMGTNKLSSQYFGIRGMFVLGALEI